MQYNTGSAKSGDLQYRLDLPGMGICSIVLDLPGLEICKRRRVGLTDSPAWVGRRLKSFCKVSRGVVLWLVFRVWFMAYNVRWVD